MSRRKYSFSGDDWPRNNGSTRHPARFTVRCTNREFARWRKAVRRIAETFGETKLSQSAVCNRRVLKMLEDFSWRQTFAKARGRLR